MNRLWEILVASVVLMFGLLYTFAGPLTFVYLVYIDAQTSHTFFQWLILIICDVVLATIWPIYWFIELIKHVFNIG